MIITLMSWKTLSLVEKVERILSVGPPKHFEHADKLDGSDLAALQIAGFEIEKAQAKGDVDIAYEKWRDICPGLESENDPGSDESEEASDISEPVKKRRRRSASSLRVECPRDGLEDS